MQHTKRDSESHGKVLKNPYYLVAMMVFSPDQFPFVLQLDPQLEPKPAKKPSKPKTKKEANTKTTSVKKVKKVSKRAVSKKFEKIPTIAVIKGLCRERGVPGFSKMCKDTKLKWLKKCQ